MVLQKRNRQLCRNLLHTALICHLVPAYLLLKTYKTKNWSQFRGNLHIYPIVSLSVPKWVFSLDIAIL